MDQHVPLQAKASLLSFQHEFSRAESVRLHGFRQKRALKRGGLNKHEINYLKFAAEGELTQIRKMFSTHNDDLDKNCTDYFERTALVLAITNGHLNVVEYLLNQEVDLTESLFYAIETEFIEAVEAILVHNQPRRENYREMLITSQESIFPRFLSPIMLAAHKNNYEILEMLYIHGHRLRDLSRNASNKWDQIRLKWLYYKAKASQAYMILLYNKDNVDPLNEAIEFYGELKKEGEKSREVRENYRELAKQCEDFAISLLDQIRTAQELADLLRFCLVDRDLGNTNELVLRSLPVLIYAGSTQDGVSVQDPDDPRDIHGSADLNWQSPKTPQINVITTQDAASRSSSRPGTPTNASCIYDSSAEIVRNHTNTLEHRPPSRLGTPRKNSAFGSLDPNSNDPYVRRLSSTLESVPAERRRTLGMRHKSTSVDLEFARPIHFLKPIEKAVNNGMIRLVTCENSQLALTYLKDGLMFRDVANTKSFFKKCLVGFMFPFISIAFLLFPNSRIGLIARNPTAKLWMEVASDIALIFFLILNLLLTQIHVIKSDDFSPLLIVAYTWMPGKFINLVFLAYHQRKRVIYSIWNWNDLASILCYTTFMILRIYQHNSGNTSMDQWTPVPISDIFISIVYILVFLRPLEILRVNRVFGPLQVSIDRMMKDVLKFVLIFIVFWFAFSSGLNTLFLRYRACANNNGTEGNDTCCFGNDKFTNLGVSLQIHFWSIFGYSDEYAEWFNLTCGSAVNRNVTTAFGQIIFAFYHVGTVLVLVNMLIAIMSGTLQRTIDESDIQWQFHRTRVWIRFIRTGFYRPPPMNLIPRPKEIVFGFRVVVRAFKSMCRGDSRKYFARQEEPPKENGIEMSPYQFRASDVSDLQHSPHLMPRSHNMSTDALSVRSLRSHRPSLASIEECHSRYDRALRKCVKRYLKTNVLQTDQHGYLKNDIHS